MALMPYPPNKATALASSPDFHELLTLFLLNPAEPLLDLGSHTPWGSFILKRPVVGTEAGVLLQPRWIWSRVQLQATADPLGILSYCS